MAVDDLDALEETIAILSDSDALRQLAASDAELARGEGDRAGSRGCDAPPSEVGVSPDRFDLIISPTARRQVTDKLSDAVAFAAYEFIVGPLLDNPHRVGKRLRRPLDDRYSAAAAPAA